MNCTSYFAVNRAITLGGKICHSVLFIYNFCLLNMEVDENALQLYVRTPDDVKVIVKHAKLDERQLTQVTQALYYPSATIVSDNLRLLELDEHMLQQIRTGQTLHFKGGLHEKVVLCTDERTYDVKGAEISNSLLVVPELKFGAATSTSPLKSPRSGNANASLERSLNDSTEDDLEVPRTLEQRQVLKIFHEYFECREIRPRYRKLGELLQLTRYSGPENEYCIDRKLLFSFQQLLDTVQCSRAQFEQGLRQFRAIELDGHIRILDCEYEYRIINLMLGLLSENSWALDEVEREVTIYALQGIAPDAIVTGLFDIYVKASDRCVGKFKYDESLVARIVAQNILQHGLRFRNEEFMSTWQDALPEGMFCKLEYLRGLGICDKEGAQPCIRSLAEDQLPFNINDRMRSLFKTKRKWTLDEMEPYIDCFTTPTLSVSTLLAKHARSLTENGIRYFVSKH
ncbi:sister chromatid cohesion protein DCC1 [Drosophila busckii]|uniref:sister chromatid cohesion protein DCC1 n=1 Tax=Drosophila busckii TaxID=30019 RepID=UPI001432973E|nr:sister chromatid cohesion protein DCC1 [Drosophila busckii]